MSHEKIDRNKQVYKMHVGGLTFAEIGKFFKIKRETACDIYQQYKKKYIDKLPVQKSSK